MRDLTARKREVLHLISVGYRNKEIARSLGIAEQTVKNAIMDLFDYFKATNRAHLVRTAFEKGEIW